MRSFPRRGARRARRSTSTCRRAVSSASSSADLFSAGAIEFASWNVTGPTRASRSRAAARNRSSSSCAARSASNAAAVGATAVERAERVEDAEMRRRVEQRLMFVLTVQFDEARRRDP